MKKKKWIEKSVMNLIWYLSYASTLAQASARRTTGRQASRGPWSRSRAARRGEIAPRRRQRSGFGSRRWRRRDRRDCTLLCQWWASEPARPRSSRPSRSLLHRRKWRKASAATFAPPIPSSQRKEWIVQSFSLGVLKTGGDLKMQNYAIVLMYLFVSGVDVM